MRKRFIFYSVIFFLAFGILFSSIYRSASVRYAFSQAPIGTDTDIPDVEYQLPGPGMIGPDDPVWLLEVIRDKAWLTVTTDSADKAEILLLIANKRIAYAEQLSYRGKYEEAISVAQKAEMYLESAYENLRLASEDGQVNSEIVSEMSLASLKHRQLIEGIGSRAPVDAQEIISEINVISKLVYERTTHMLNDMNVSVVDSPFAE